MELHMSLVVPTFTIGLVTYLLCTWIYNAYFHPLSKFPGPLTWTASRIPFIISMVSGRLPHDYRAIHERYNSSVVRVAPNELSFIQPEAWKDIYTKPDWIRPWELRGKPPGTTADNLISSTETDHARFRKVLGPGFSEQAIQKQQPIIDQYFDMFIEGLRRKVTDSQDRTAIVDVVEWLNYAAFDIIGDLGFGSSFDCLKGQKLSGWVQVVLHFKAVIIAASFKYLAPLDRIIEAITPKSALEDINMVVDTAREKIAQRMALKSHRPDIIGHIENKSNLSMSREEVELNAFAIIVAGSESVTTVLTGVINNLLSYPETMKRLVEEVRTTFQKEDDITGITTAKSAYLNAVLNEGMRTCPSIPDGSRRNIPAGIVASIAGHIVPGPATVSVPQWSAYTSESNFSDAMAFAPERWLPGSEKYGRDLKNVFQPFGIGAHNCIGQPLAWLEMRVILARLLYNFDLKLPANGEPIRWSAQEIFWTWVKEPLKVELTVAKP